MPETSAYLERLDLNATSQIEAGNPDEVEEGEFAPSEFDVEPAGTFQSISPSVLCHSYENGRRVRYPGSHMGRIQLTRMRG